MPPLFSEYLDFALQQPEIALQPRILDGEYGVDLGRGRADQIVVSVLLDKGRRDVYVHYLADTAPDPFTGLVPRTEGQRAVLRGSADAVTSYEFCDRGRSSDVIHQRVLR